MASPNLPTNVVDGTTGHETHHNTAHGMLNKLDAGIAATAGYVPIGDGTTLVTRAMLSTDNPAVVMNAQTASYTLVASDAGKLVEMNVASANNLVIPSGVFSAGQVVACRQYGAGTTTNVGSGVTLRSRGAVVASAGQYAEWTVTFRSATEAVLSGDLV